MQLGQDWGLRVEKAGWGRIEWLSKKTMEAEGGACDSVEDLGEDVLFSVVAVSMVGQMASERQGPASAALLPPAHPSFLKQQSLFPCRLPFPAPGGPCGA